MMAKVSRLLACALLALLIVGCAESGSESVEVTQHSAASDAATSPRAASAVAGTAASGSANQGLVGEWTLTIDTPRGVSHPRLTVTESKGSYSATYQGRQGLLQIAEVVSDGNNFSFPLSITVPIGTIEVVYQGQITGDRMVGVVQNPRGEVPFSGERK